MLHVERYHHNPNMWEYIRTTRIPTEDIFGLVDRESRSLDKVQALFADLDLTVPADHRPSRYTSFHPEIPILGSTEKVALEIMVRFIFVSSIPSALPA